MGGEERRDIEWVSDMFSLYFSLNILISKYLVRWAYTIYARIYLVLITLCIRAHPNSMADAILQATT